jgi:hypothetical protein
MTILERMHPYVSEIKVISRIKIIIFKMDPANSLTCKWWHNNDETFSL